MYAVSALFDFGASARYVTACVIGSTPSGSPTSSTACSALTATTSACGSALPTSSLAKITMRRSTNRGSSPASSMRVIQYTAASGSEPRMLLMNTLITP